MEVVRPGDLIPDSRLAGTDQDLLDHDAIARGVAEIALAAETPVNIALFGAWGSGKSSTYSMIQAHLQRVAPGRVRLARYDAWKYGGQELKRNFIHSISAELGIKDEEFVAGLDNERVDTRLDTWGWVQRNFRSLVVSAALALVVAALWLLAQAVAMALLSSWDFIPAAQSLLGSTGTVFGLALVAALLGPKALEGIALTTRIAPPQGSDQFAKLFEELVRKALKGRQGRLVVFIDELDRCSPDAVVSTLVDLKTFLDHDRCVFIVAADRDVIERALREVPQAKPVREDEPYYSTSGAFLDKIFQHQLALPPLRPRALTQFAHDLVDTQQGVWQELRDQDGSSRAMFDRTIFALVPVHVRSPRRVKVLLNNFATNARVASSRGINWLDRVHEIAVLSVLQTEFPSVAEDLRRAPRLLAYLRREDRASGELAKLVTKYLGEGSLTPGPSPSGELLTDDGLEDVALEEAATETMRRHLLGYLAKVAAAGIRDPRPDLLYLQMAGGRELLPDPTLGDLIDLASDTAPDTVVEAFSGQESRTLSIAIPLLVIEGDQSFGPGQEFAYQAACRLVHLLDESDRGPVAEQIKPSLVAAATNRTLTDAAVPGALLAACWAGANDVVERVLAEHASSASTELLEGFTVLVPHLQGKSQTALFTILGNAFNTQHDPLIAALRDSSAEEALALWTMVSGQVLEVLNDLEAPEDEDADSQASPQPVAPRGQRTALPVEPAETEWTGKGVSLLSKIVEAVRVRDEHEALLSSVLSTVQGDGSVPALRDWVRSSTLDHIEAMSSTTRRAWHAFLGLQYDRPELEDTWAAMLPSPERLTLGETEGDDASPDLRKAVATAASERLLALVATFADAPAEQVDHLGALVDKVHGWAEVPPDDLAAALSSSLDGTGWVGADEDDEASEALWARKEGLLRAVKTLAGADDSSLFPVFVEDLVAPVSRLTLTELFIKHWLTLASNLPTASATKLSEAMESLESPDDESEEVALLRLQLRVRDFAEEPAPEADRVLRLELGEHRLEVVDQWLALRPPVQESSRLLTSVQGSPRAISTYCGTLSALDRTVIWLALREIQVEAAMLKAAGAAGLAGTAVEAVASAIKEATPESERKRLAGQLMGSPPSSEEAREVKRPVTELALHLMERSTAGDVRTAAELLVWAGGAAYGKTQVVREAIDRVSEPNRSQLTQGLTEDLVRLNLMKKPAAKSSVRPWVRRRR